MVDLLDGQAIEIQGSASRPCTLKNVDGVSSCSCPAWRNQSQSIDRRTCKHLRHLRGDDKELRSFPGVGAKPIWMTEWAQRFHRGDIAFGAEYGPNILNAPPFGAEAWLPIEWRHPSGNRSGLISVDFAAKAPRQRYWRSKAYHIFRQIANTSPPGAQIVSMTGKWKGTKQSKGGGVEYLALRHGDKTIVHLMNTEPAPVTFRITGRGLSDKLDAWLTTPLAGMAATELGALKVVRQGETCTISGIIAANTLLSLVAVGPPAKSKAP